MTETVCTQNGSKTLQHYLDELSGELCEAVVAEIVAEVLPTGCKIICDTFGNYFYQVGERGRRETQLLFKKATTAQKEALLQAMLFPKEGAGSTICGIAIQFGLICFSAAYLP